DHLLYNEPCKIVPQDIFTPNKWHLTKNYRRCLVIKMASKDTAQLILGTISVQASENDQGFFQQTLINVFDDAGYSLATADACGYHSIFFVEALHIVKDLHGEFATCAPQRVAECDGASIYIHFGRIESGFANNCQRL